MAEVVADGPREQGKNSEFDERFVFAIRWEWAEKNPIERTSERETHAGSRCADSGRDHGIAREIAATSTDSRGAGCVYGSRRGELIGLQWEDVDFENLVIHVRLSVVIMVSGSPKTEAPAKGRSSRCGLGQLDPEAETRWSLQQGNGLGFRFVDDEGQETVVAGNAVASARTPSSEGCKDREGE